MSFKVERFSIYFLQHPLHENEGAPFGAVSLILVTEKKGKFFKTQVTTHGEFYTSEIK